MGIWITLIGLLVSCGAQDQKVPQKQAAQQLAPYVERNQKQFNFLPGGKLEITAALPGNVAIIGWQRSSIMVEMEKIIFNVAADQATVLSAQYPIQLRWTQTTATIRTSGPPQSAATMEVNLRVYVPKIRTDVKVKLLQGDLAIGAINGWVEATLTEGSIEAKSMSGYFSGVTQKGDVHAEMAGRRWEGHGFTAATHQGTIELRLPVEYSAALQLETRNGEISINYPAQVVEGESLPLTATSRRTAHSLKASVGDGGSPISLLTYAGNVRLATKETP
jgi:DUF4097 and DUF4098 domain-containing protein YvlB